MGFVFLVAELAAMVSATLIVIGPSARNGWGWLALTGPAFMYWLLVFAAGIPPLEAHMLRSRGAASRAYQARVSAFWPRPPSPSKETRR